MRVRAEGQGQRTRAWSCAVLLAYHSTHYTHVCVCARVCGCVCVCVCMHVCDLRPRRLGRRRGLSVHDHCRGLSRHQRRFPISRPSGSGRAVAGPMAFTAPIHGTREAVLVHATVAIELEQLTFSPSFGPFAPTDGKGQGQGQGRGQGEGPGLDQQGPLCIGLQSLPPPQTDPDPAPLPKHMHTYIGGGGLI